MKKILLSTLLLSAYAAMSQMPMHSKWHNDSTVNFSMVKTIGLTGQKFDNLNDRIDNYPQYKALPEVIFSIGAGSILEKGHFVVLNGISLGYAMNGNKEKKNSTLGYLGINGDVGYNFLGSTSKAKIYPTVGLGLEGYRARFNKAVEDVSFNAVLGSNELQNDVRSVTFYNLFFNYRVGLNLALESPDKSGSMGLQLGYTGSFTENSWRINYNQKLQNAPEDRLTRLFANLYFTKSLKWGDHKMMW
jgi:hypothetical protein